MSYGKTNEQIGKTPAGWGSIGRKARRRYKRPQVKQRRLQWRHAISTQDFDALPKTDQHRYFYYVW